MPLQNTFTLDVDFKVRNLINEPIVTQNDEVTFILNVYDDGQEFALSSVSTFTLVSVRTDKQSVMTLGNKTGINQITFALGSTEISVVGKINAVIQLYDVDGRVSTLPFTYQVLKDPATNYVPSTDEQTLIELVLGQGPAILADAKQATVDANAAAQSVEQIKNETMAVKDATEQVRIDTLAVKNATEIIKDETIDVKDATDIVKNETEILKVSTEKAKDDAIDATNAINLVLPNVLNLGYIEPYDATTQYEKNNIVRHGKNSYIALQPTLGNEPTGTIDSPYWGVLAVGGIDGLGSVISVNGVGPNANGDVILTIPDPDLSGLATKVELQALDDEVTSLQEELVSFDQRLTDIRVNVKDFGALGDGSDDTQAFIDALLSLKQKRDSYRLINGFQSNTGTTLTLDIPSGFYKITQTIGIPKGITLIGVNNGAAVFTETNITIFDVLDDIPERVVEGALQDEDLYTEIKGLSVFGPLYGTNPFAAYTGGSATSCGIVVNTHRVRIRGCNIVGFRNSGIVVNKKYYITIKDNKLTHSGKGIFLDGGTSDFVTATKVTHNEIRLNGQGVSLNRAFGNSINDNTIESNIANYLPGTDTQPVTHLSKGKAIVLRSSHENTFKNNYVENHIANILFYNSYSNNISDNYLVAGNDATNHHQIIFDGNNNFNNLLSFNEMRGGVGTVSSLITVYDYNSVQGTVFYTFNLDDILSQNSIWNNGFIGVETKAPIIIEPKSNRIYKNKVVKNITLS
ncbi:right-handed parallel beta-helix repeat-containing protein [Psychrobacillus sp. FSL K6-2365]|uniref:glycosyl hydrolase family 28-related protein n=1 Tax=Psychrobacillus sp. FSL K6-2365 TaxID=2921546 RepID=UPI0030FCFA03